jgi:hypothetical protein
MDNNYFILYRSNIDDMYYKNLLILIVIPFLFFVLKYILFYASNRSVNKNETL